MTNEQFFPQNKFPLRAKTSYTLPESTKEVEIEIYYQEPVNLEQDFGILVRIRHDNRVIFDGLLFVEYDGTETFYIASDGDYKETDEDYIKTKIAELVNDISMSLNKPYDFYTFTDSRFVKKNSWRPF